MAEEIEKEGGVVMDTPERTQIATPLSKFEDSPVFSYINSLSPIKPVKSMHITQTFSSLSFASLPSVFTSPHVSSLKESRFLRRHQFSDPLKLEPTSDNAKKASTSEGIPDAGRNPSKRQKDFDPGTENSVVPSYESSNLEIELSGTFSYRSVRPDTKNIPEMTAPSTSIVPFVQDSSTNELLRSETVTEVIDPVNHNKEVVGCDWDSLISDASELLNFGSPSDTVPFKGHDQSTLDPTKFAPVNDTAKLDAAGQLALENPSEKGENLKETAENQEILANDSLNSFVDGEPAENRDNEVGCNIYRGMRRRCLVFEMVGSRRKHLEAGSSCGSLNVSESNETIAYRGKRPVPVRTGDDTSRCILPGIGLHLNALASTSVDQKVVKHEALDSGRQLIISPLSAAACQPVTSGQESSNKFSGTLSLEKDISPANNEVLVAEDVSKALGCVVNEELLNQTSPKKKRRRVENAGESEACKRCNCKKSRCLKLYCECFAAGVYCVEPCSCQECFNKPIHEDTVLATRKQIESRNPLAFAPKVIRSSDSMLEIGDESSKTPASARHKRGCNCKKSGCLKKYCECYQGGVGCSINCRCEGCKNAFGRKDGSETDLEVNDGDECEGNAVDGSSQKNTMRNDSELISATPATPSRLGRQLIPLPISSKTKQRRSFLAIGSSSQRFGKLNPFQAPGKFDQQLQAVHEDEIPEILLGNNSSPISGVKSSSPNGKRISPPHSSMGSSPGQKSSRKLILQSIPSFPSLTPKH